MVLPGCKNVPVDVSTLVEEPVLDTLTPETEVLTTPPLLLLVLLLLCGLCGAGACMKTFAGEAELVLPPDDELAIEELSRGEAN